MFSAILWRPLFRPERSAEGGLKEKLNAPSNILSIRLEIKNFPAVKKNLSIRVEIKSFPAVKKYCCSTWAKAHCQTPVLYNYGQFLESKKLERFG